MAAKGSKAKKSQTEQAAQAEAEVEQTDIPQAEQTAEATQVDTLKAELKKMTAEKDQYLDMAQRARAEFDNYRRRTEAQRFESRNDGIRDTVNAILPVIDNMERALAAAADVAEDDPLKKGIDMVFKQLMETLTAQSLEKIDALGQPFDPNFHHAVMEGEATDEFAAGTVMEVLQEGYIVKDKIIRYAMVKVAK